MKKSIYLLILFTTMIGCSKLPNPKTENSIQNHKLKSLEEKMYYHAGFIHNEILNRIMDKSLLCDTALYTQIASEVLYDSLEYSKFDSLINNNQNLSYWLHTYAGRSDTSVLNYIQRTYNPNIHVTSYFTMIYDSLTGTAAMVHAKILRIIDLIENDGNLNETEKNGLIAIACIGDSSYTFWSSLGGEPADWPNWARADTMGAYYGLQNSGVFVAFGPWGPLAGVIGCAGVSSGLAYFCSN